MSKSTRIANAKGSVPVQGCEKEVSRFRTDYFFSKRLTESIDEQKAAFRQRAADVLRGVEGAKRAEFLDKAGRSVTVSLMDTSSPGNRSDIKADAVKKALQLGVNLAELDIMETAVSYVLTGPYVEVIEAYLNEHFVSKGLPIPDGATKRESSKLSVAGVARLNEMIAAGGKKGEAAKILLEAGTKAASVGVPDTD